MKPHLHSLTALGLAALAAGCAAPPATTTTQAITPTGGERLVMSIAARGVQIYECKAAAAGEAPKWQFTAPQATLYDTRGRAIGLHGAGPYWEAKDGSRLEGKVTARTDSPTAGSIPWLLLSSTSSGPQGRFSGVSSIQRVHTQGGVAPKAGCDATAIGRVERVPYTADYLLYRG
jgi:hypothetical protein